jgi:hypothetical protein
MSHAIHREEGYPRITYPSIFILVPPAARPPLLLPSATFILKFILTLVPRAARVPPLGLDTVNVRVGHEHRLARLCTPAVHLRREDRRDDRHGRNGVARRRPRRALRERHLGHGPRRRAAIREGVLQPAQRALALHDRDGGVVRVGMMRVRGVGAVHRGDGRLGGLVRGHGGLPSPPPGAGAGTGVVAAAEAAVGFRIFDDLVLPL